MVQSTLVVASKYLHETFSTSVSARKYQLGLAYPRSRSGLSIKPVLSRCRLELKGCGGVTGEKPP